MTRGAEHAAMGGIDDIFDDVRELMDQQEAAIRPRSDATDRSGRLRVSLAPVPPPGTTGAGQPGRNR